MSQHQISLPPDMPRAMRNLSRNSAGYPVPFFVQYIDGQPDFRVMNGEHLRRAVAEHLCWLCGEPLRVKRGSYRRMGTFVAGPMCLINRNSAEPPSHAECAAWATRACPFLVNPNKLRREHGIEGLTENVAGFSIDRNPGVTALIHCSAWQPYHPEHGGSGVLFDMTKIDGVDFLARGEPAKLSEVFASIDSGLPALVALAETEHGGMADLTKVFRRAMTHIVASSREWASYPNMVRVYG